MQAEDFRKLLPKNLDLEYLVTQQDDSKLGKALTQLRALKAIRKMLNDQAQTASDIPSSILIALNTLIVQRSQLMFAEISSMSLVPIPEKDLETANIIMTN